MPAIIIFGNATTPSRFAHFWQGAESLAPAKKVTVERPKVLQTRGIFLLLTSKCASCHRGVHFFNIATDQSRSEPAALASLLLDLPEPQNIGKTQ
jgi:hypothetical protein